MTSEPGNPAEAAGPDDVVAALQLLAAAVRPPRRAEEAAARGRLDGLLVAPGSLGTLHRLALWWGGVRRDGRPEPERAEVVVLAADHGIAVRGVSALPLGHTRVAAQAVRDGCSATDAAARTAGCTVRLLDVDVAGPTGPRSAPFDVADGLTAEVALGCVRRGDDLAAELAAADLDVLVLGELHTGGSTTSAAVVGAVQRLRVLDVVGRGSGVDDTAWMRKAVAVREGLRRARSRPRDAGNLLLAVGSADVAFATGLLIGCAARGLPVVLDGPVTAAAAALAHRVSATSRQWWLFPERTEEPCVHRVQDALGMVPVGDLGVRAGGGVAGLATLGQLRLAASLLEHTATTEQAWPALSP